MATCVRTVRRRWNVGDVTRKQVQTGGGLKTSLHVFAVKTLPGDDVRSLPEYVEVHRGHIRDTLTEELMDRRFDFC